jgi:hypothetical protein
MVFLFASLLGRQILSTFEQTLLVKMAAEGLLIFGWVTLWEPVYIFIYGWWPIVQKRRIYDKISLMQVEVLPVPHQAINTAGLHASRPVST